MLFYQILGNAKRRIHMIQNDTKHTGLCTSVYSDLEDLEWLFQSSNLTFVAVDSW